MNMEDEDDSPAPQSRAAFVTRLVNQVQLYKKLLLQYWWIPALCIALGIGIESLVLKHVPPTFLSSGRMIVNPRISIPNANVYNEELVYFYGTQVALMKSDSVVNRVRQRLKAASPDLPEVPVVIDVAQSPKTSIYDVKAAGGNAAYVQAYLQATMEEYIKLKKDLLANTTTATQSSMEGELKQMGVELEKSKQDLLNFQVSNNVVLLQPNGGNAAAEYLQSLKRQLDERNSELLLLKTSTLDQNLQRLRDDAAKNTAPSNRVAQAALDVTPAAAPPAVGNNPDATPANLGDFEEAYLQIKQQLIMKRAERDMETNILAPDSRDMVNLNKQVGQLEMQLAIDRQQSLEQMTNRQVTLERQIAGLTSLVTEWEQKALEVSKKLAGFKALEENEKRLQSLYDGLQASLQTLDVNKGINQESVSILEPAGFSEPLPLQKGKHLLMAALIGSILGIGILVFLGLLNDRPSTFTELEQLFDLPILGQIPLLKSGDHRPPILQGDDQRYPLVESFRSLRSAFLYKDAIKGETRQPPKNIVIASAYPSEGKSTTAANFAITLAQAGARVLLIDADLHRGVLHEQFGTPLSPGLAEVFAGQCVWNGTVVETSVPNLYLLPRGTIPRKAGNLFARSGKFLADVAGSYDFCIFDSAPVMMSDDVLTLAPQVDAVMMVIRAGFTSGRIAKAAMDLLRLRRVAVAGLIFNAVPPNTGDYYNYRAKEYYVQQNPAD
jgi:capsular exopolysaccharide synthesis family protein